MNHETLEQQTAPESTRGLFDGPEVLFLLELEFSSVFINMFKLV
jgi:hypothetical protein